MKFLAVFAALVAVACGAQNSWNLSQISAALENPTTDPAVVPYLEQALNDMMATLFAGQNVEYVAVNIPAVDLSAWTLEEISNALTDSETDPALIPYLENALNDMMTALITGQPVVGAVTAVVPPMDVTYWSLQQIDAALGNELTNPALKPYLVQALNDIMTALFAGNQIEAIVVVTPAGLLEPLLVPAVPAPAPSPVVPSPVELPIVPTPVETPAASSSPLVQIIVNIKQQETVPVTPGGATAVPEVQPSPVIVVDQAQPESIFVVDQAPIEPSPVTVIDQTPESEVSIVTPEFNPIDAVPMPGIIAAPAIVATPAVVGPLL